MNTPEQSVPVSGRYWTTDLSPSLGVGKWVVIILFILFIVTIPLAILLYLYWKKQLISTLTIHANQMNIYQSGGRKINPKVTRFYLNPHAVVTSAGVSEITRKKLFLFLAVLFGFLTISALANNPNSAIVLAMLTGLFILLFLVIVDRYHLSIFNLEVHGSIGGSETRATSGIRWWLVIVLLILFWPLGIYYLWKKTEKESGKKDPHIVDINSAKLRGHVDLSKMSSVVFIGVDTGAEAAYRDLNVMSRDYVTGDILTQISRALEQPTDKWVFCPNCGVRNEAGSNFCIHCGAMLENS